MTPASAPADHPPLVLIFGPYDPSGSGNLPADAVTCAQLGGHAVSALTAMKVQDTAHTEDVQPVGPELLDDQARCLLEDMRVQAMKVGPLYTTESVSVVAQIAADYSDVPLVLHLEGLPDDTTSLPDPFESEDIMLALFELLLPQTDLVIADHDLLQRWQSAGLFDAVDGDTPRQALFNYGADWVLTTQAPVRAGQQHYHLQDADGSTFTWSASASGLRPINPDAPLACAVTLGLARGLTVQSATEQAVAFAARSMQHTFQPGMGSRIYNRSQQP